MKAKSNNTSRYEKNINIIQCIGIALIFIVIPIYIENRYFNVTRAKGIALLVVASLFVLAILINEIFYIKKKVSIFSLEKIKKNISLVDIGVISFAIVSLTSTFLSINPDASLLGSDGWWNGSLEILLLTIIYFFIAHNDTYSKKMWRPIIIVQNILLIIAILHATRTDFMYLHSGIYADDYFSYLSLYGNTNQMSLFIAMLFPVVLSFYLTSNDKRNNRLYISYIVLACFGIILCASDSIYLALFLIVLFGMRFFLKEEDRIRKCFLTLMIFGLVLVFIKTIPSFNDIVINMGGVSKTLLNYYISIPITIIGALGFFLLKSRWCRLRQKTVNIIHKVVVGILIAIGVAVVVINIISFDELWGTSRGGIWIRSFDLYFNKLTLGEKIIGVGPEILKSVYGEIATWFHKAVLSSHNQAIQVLITTGLVGLIAKVILWSGVVKMTIKNKTLQNEKIAFVLPVVSYFGVMILNTPSAMNTAAFYVFLALLVKTSKNDFDINNITK